MNFIHFGCWNNINNNTINVLKMLDMYIKKNNIEFLSIAGDNYYPDKYKKDKTFNLEKFKVSFDLLNKIDIPKYIIYGNHDILDFEDCRNLFEQIKYKDGNNFIFYDGIKYNNYDNTIIFFLDSTIYELYKEDAFLIEDTCYKYIFPQFNKISDIINYQYEYIKHLLLSFKNKKNIIFTFHHPLISKYISSKGNVKETYLYKLIDEFYIKLYDLLHDKNIYHLCADTHFYQNGNINITFNDKNLIIKQHIVGTGGTVLDNIYEDNIEYVDEKWNINYRPINTIKNYGFLHIKSVEDDLIFDFIQVDLELFKNKYIKYKRKYLELLKQIN